MSDLRLAICLINENWHKCNFPQKIYLSWMTIHLICHMNTFSVETFIELFLVTRMSKIFLGVWESSSFGWRKSSNQCFVRSIWKNQEESCQIISFNTAYSASSKHKKWYVCCLVNIWKFPRNERTMCGIKCFYAPKFKFMNRALEIC